MHWCFTFAQVRYFREATQLGRKKKIPVERTQELRGAVQDLIDARQSWVDSDATAITADFENCLSECIATFADGDMPSDCQELAYRVAAVAIEWEKFAGINGEGGYGSTINPAPRGSFWYVFDRLTDFYHNGNYVRRPLLEPVAVLHAQKVTHRQIARMYGWFARPGIPDEQKVREELEKPGRHTGDGFVPPAIREHERQELADWAAKQQALENMQRRYAQSKPDAGPETVEELILQGVSIRQIARMRETTEEAVIAACEQMGVKPVLPVNLPTQRAPTEPEISEDAKKVGPREKRSTEDEVLHRHGQGYAAKDIAKMVNLPAAEVQAIIDAAEAAVEQDAEDLANV